MKKFFLTFQIFLLLLLVINPFILIAGEQFFGTYSTNDQILIGLTIALIDFFIIIAAIRKFYQGPIVKLELTLKHFLIGNLKDSEIKFDKSLNPHLNYILAFFSKTINTLKNIKDEFIHGKEIKGEVELAKEIQERMLAKKMVDIPSLEIVMKTKPAGEIGGDSHDIIKQGENYYIYVGDATGHGVGAGFIMVMVNALVSSLSKIYKSGAEILKRTNEELKPRVKANLLMSMLLLRWNEEEKRLFMTGAGHEYLMIYKQSTNKVYKIKSGGVALGMIQDIDKLIKEQEIKFEKGDIAVLYSDGITEAINTPKKDGNENFFGEKRLEDAIFKAPNMKGEKYKTARSVFNNITIYLSKFMGYKSVQLDDITLAVIQFKPDGYELSKDFKTELPKDFITEWYWD